MKQTTSVGAEPGLGTQPATADQVTEEIEAGRVVSRRRQIVHQLMGNRTAMLGFFLLVLVIALSALAPWIGRYDPEKVPTTFHFTDLNQNPTWTHWFGTDYLGRDMWARILWGGRISLPAGVAVLALACSIGVPLGLIAGYTGRLLDDLIMRTFDVLLSLPGILLAIGIVSILGPGLTSAEVAIGIATSPAFARLARGTTLSVKATEYVEAARAQGAGPIYIMLHHILPNVVDTLIVYVTLGLGGAILATAALSFLGIGTQLPTSDWGTLLTQGNEHMFQSWSEITFPGIFIMVTVLGINLFGDGLGEAINPRLSVR